jgi:hypothetical protein
VWSRRAQREENDVNRKKVVKIASRASSTARGKVYSIALSLSIDLQLDDD